jgi:hypothetical protein
VLVDTILQMNCDGLGVRTAEGAGDTDVFPFAANLDYSGAEGHLRINDFAIGTCGQRRRDKAERSLKPFDGWSW